VFGLSGYIGHVLVLSFSESIVKRVRWDAFISEKEQAKKEEA
jgi:hypothetical protein